MSDADQRIAELEARLEGAFAIDGRIKALESEISGLKKSSVSDWLRALGPFASSLALLFVGYWVNDSVKQALDRETLDLAYVTQMRDLIKEFDSSTTQAAANANAISLAMYGRHAIMPLIERLRGGDLANIAAEKGLLLVGTNDPVVTCPKFVAIIDDKARRFPWQTHKTIIRVMGQSECVKSIPELNTYRALLSQLGTDTNAIAKFSHRYSEPAGFDGASATGLRDEIDNALEILNAKDKP
jgi:hypothetical protein